MARAVGEPGHPGAKRSRDSEAKTIDGSKGSAPSSSTTTTTTTKKAKQEDEEGSTEKREDKQRELFLSSREGAGTSWETELLLPPTAAAAGDDDASGATVDVEAVEGRAAAKKSSKKKEKTKASAVDQEEEALQLQQTLETVDDLDFLAQLAEPSEEEQQGQQQQQQDNTDHEDEEQQQQQHPVTTSHASPSPSSDKDIAMMTRRVRIMNLPYLATSAQIKQHLSSLIGPIDTVHIPLTRDTRQSKGCAFIRFTSELDAVRALTELPARVFMGRLLKVAAAEEDPYQPQAGSGGTTAADVEVSGGNAGSSALKREQQLARREQEASGKGAASIAARSSTNGLFLNSSAAVSHLARQMNVKEEEVVGGDHKGAATRAAIAEALLTSEAYKVLSDEGIALDLLNSSSQHLLKRRSTTTILVKNLAINSAEEWQELVKRFSRYGVLELTALPQSGLFALLRFTQEQDAKVAFSRLAYSVFHNSPLYLEWAPVGSLKEHDDDDEEAAEGTQLPQTGDTSQAATAPSYTLFLTNVPFKLQSEDDLRSFLADTCPRVAANPDVCLKRIVWMKDKGRAYVTLNSQLTMAAAQRSWNGKTLLNRVLSCVPSTSGTPAAAPTGDADDEDADHDQQRVMGTSVIRGSAVAASQNGVPAGCDPLKLVVKNLPFEATEKDVRVLFEAFSEVRSVRLPRKVQQFSHHRDNHHRGFAFVEFLSESEAARALQSLKATHLYGRHLVLQYAKLEDVR